MRLFFPQSSILVAWAKPLRDRIPRSPFSLLLSTLAFLLCTFQAAPSARAYEWQNSAIWESDSAFTSGPAWFSAGPAWLMRAMPGAQFRARQYVLDRSGDREQSTSDAPYVGTLHDVFNVNLFNNVSGFAAGSGAPKISPSRLEAFTSGTWTNTAGGNWSTTTNWSGGTVADGAGSTADFSTINIGAITVTIDTTSRTIGTFLVGDTTSPFSAYTFSSTGSATLTFNNSGSGAVLTQTANTGSNIFDSSLAIILADNLTINNNAANGANRSLTIAGGITGAFNLTINSNGATTNAINLNTTTINNGGTITNSGTGTGTTTVNAVIGASVTGVTQNSATSALALTNSGNTYAGNTTITLGTLSVDGDATLGDGTGTLFLSGGALSTTADRSAGSNNIPNNVVLTANSTLTTSSTANVNLVFSGGLSGTGGTLTASASTTSAANFFDVRFNGGDFTMSRPIVLTNSGAGTTRWTDANATGTTHTYNGAISGNGSFRRLTGAAGTTIFNVANAYTGATVIGGGTLLVNGSTAAASAVTVNSIGTILGGTGTINGTVTLGNTATGAILNPGPQGTNGTAASVGTLTTGALTLTGANTFHVDAFGTLTTQWDQLVVNGTVTLGTTSTLELSIASGLTFTPLVSQYTLINNDGILDAISGTFANAPNLSIISAGGYDFLVNYNGGDGNDLTLTAVPEPSTWIGAALALGAIGVTQRKRFAKRLRVTG